VHVLSPLDASKHGRLYLLLINIFMLTVIWLNLEHLAYLLIFIFVI
jgi:hypothetical protein